MLRRVWYSVSSGLLAGMGVGLAEAIYTLAGVDTDEYAALVVAAVLYSLLGLGLGLLLALPLALLEIARPLPEPTGWLVRFLLVFCLMGSLVVYGVVGEQVYLGQRPPPRAEGWLALGFAALGAAGLWLGDVILRQTPLKILLRPRGTLALYAACTALAALFSITPGGDRHDTLVSGRHQPPDLREHPNVLLITAEGLRASAAADPSVMPRLHGLSLQGVRFPHAFAQAPATRPAVAALLCGQLPSSLGQLSPAAVPDAAASLAEVLAARTYGTGALPGSGELARTWNFQQGFDWFSYQPPGALAPAAESVQRLRLYRQALRAWRRWRGPPVDAAPPGRLAVAQARRFLEANADRRWFLWIHLTETRLPGLPPGGPPGPAVAESLRARYQESARELDAQLGAILDELRRLGRESDTLVVFTADHGLALGEHGTWGGGASLYDEQLRVPLVIRLPGQPPAGESPCVARHIDLAPTVAAAVGSPPDPSWQGRDLLAPGAPCEAKVVSEGYVRGELWRAIRWEGWKLLSSDAPARRRVELYHVAQDPQERRDLSAREGPRQASLARALRRELVAARAVVLPPGAAEEP